MLNKYDQSERNFEARFADVCMDKIANTFSLLIKVVFLGIGWYLLGGCKSDSRNKSKESSFWPI